MIVFCKFPLIDALGGAELHTLKLAKHFQKTGHEVKLLSSDRKLLDLFNRHLLPAKYLWVGWEPTAKWSLLLWPITWIIAKLKFRNLLNRIPPGSTFLLQSLTEKLVITSSLFPDGDTRREKIVWLEHKVPGRWLKVNPLKRQYLKLANEVRLVTVSSFATQEFIRLGVPEKNIEAIQPGVKTIASNRSPMKNYVIGLLSRLDPEKGVFDFLSLVAPYLPSHSHWNVLIAGEGGEKLKIAKLISAPNLNKQIKLLGFVNNLDEFFSQISILVYPSKAPEAFGISALEAQSRGIPVVAANIGALPEIITHQKTGFLVEAGNPKLWIKYLERLENKNLYESLSNNALAAAQTFNEGKMFERFENLVVRPE